VGPVSPTVTLWSASEVITTETVRANRVDPAGGCTRTSYVPAGRPEAWNAPFALVLVKARQTLPAHTCTAAPATGAPPGPVTVPVSVRPVGALPLRTSNTCRPRCSVPRLVCVRPVPSALLSRKAPLTRLPGNSK
jgi:hypothetical protein